MKRLFLWWKRRPYIAALLVLAMAFSMLPAASLASADEAEPKVTFAFYDWEQVQYGYSFQAAYREPVGETGDYRYVDIGIRTDYDRTEQETRINVSGFDWTVSDRYYVWISTGDYLYRREIVPADEGQVIEMRRSEGQQPLHVTVPFAGANYETDYVGLAYVDERGVPISAGIVEEGARVPDGRYNVVTTGADDAKAYKLYRENVVHDATSPGVTYEEAETAELQLKMESSDELKTEYYSVSADPYGIWPTDWGAGLNGRQSIVLSKQRYEDLALGFRSADDEAGVYLSYAAGPLDVTGDRTVFLGTDFQAGIQTYREAYDGGQPFPDYDAAADKLDADIGVWDEHGNRLTGMYRFTWEDGYEDVLAEIVVSNTATRESQTVYPLIGDLAITLPEAKGAYEIAITAPDSPFPVAPAKKTIQVATSLSERVASVDLDAPTRLSVGEDVYVYAYAELTDRPEPRDVSKDAAFTSSDGTIFDIQPGGRGVALKPGTVTVTGEYGGKRDSAGVTVDADTTGSIHLYFDYPNDVYQYPTVRLLRGNSWMNPHARHVQAGSKRIVTLPGERLDWTADPEQEVWVGTGEKLYRFPITQQAGGTVIRPDPADQVKVEFDVPFADDGFVIDEVTFYREARNGSTPYAGKIDRITDETAVPAGTYEIQLVGHDATRGYYLTKENVTLAAGSPVIAFDADGGQELTFEMTNGTETPVTFDRVRLERDDAATVDLDLPNADVRSLFVNSEAGVPAVRAIYRTADGWEYRFSPAYAGDSASFRFKMDLKAVFALNRMAFDPGESLSMSRWNGDGTMGIVDGNGNRIESIVDTVHYTGMDPEVVLQAGDREYRAYLSNYWYSLDNVYMHFPYTNGFFQAKLAVNQGPVPIADSAPVPVLLGDADIASDTLVPDQGAYLLKPGDARQLRLTDRSVEPAADVTGEADYLSTDPGVVTVSDTGTITAVGEGEAAIVATFGGEAVSIFVRVAESDTNELNLFVPGASNDSGQADLYRRYAYDDGTYEYGYTRSAYGKPSSAGVLFTFADHDWSADARYTAVIRRADSLYAVELDVSTQDRGLIMPDPSAHVQPVKAGLLEGIEHPTIMSFDYLPEGGGTITGWYHLPLAANSSLPAGRYRSMKAFGYQPAERTFYVLRNDELTLTASAPQLFFDPEMHARIDIDVRGGDLPIALNGIGVYGNGLSQGHSMSGHSIEALYVPKGVYSQLEYAFATPDGWKYEFEQRNVDATADHSVAFDFGGGLKATFAFDRPSYPAGSTLWADDILAIKDRNGNRLRNVIPGDGAQAFNIEFDNGQGTVVTVPLNAFLQQTYLELPDVPGTYNVRLLGTGPIPVTTEPVAVTIEPDRSAPNVFVNAWTPTRVLIPGKDAMNAYSSENGALYVVPSYVLQGTPEQFERLVAEGKAMKKEAQAYFSQTIDLIGLPNGYYRVYAVDPSGNVSQPSGFYRIEIDMRLYGTVGQEIYNRHYEYIYDGAAYGADRFLVQARRYSSSSDYNGQFESDRLYWVSEQGGIVTEMTGLGDKHGGNWSDDVLQENGSPFIQADGGPFVILYERPYYDSLAGSVYRVGEDGSISELLVTDSMKDARKDAQNRLVIVQGAGAAPDGRYLRWENGAWTPITEAEAAQAVSIDGEAVVWPQPQIVNLRTEYVTETSTAITWDDVQAPRAVGYRVWTNSGTYDVASNRLELRDLVSGSFQYVDVSILYENGDTSPSRALHFYPGHYEAPEWSPFDRSFRVSDMTATTMRLHWSPAMDSEGITSYKIYRDDALIDTVTGDTLSYAAAGLQPGQSYVFRIEATDADGHTAIGDAFYGTTLTEAPNQAPVWPPGSQLTVTERTSAAVTLNWPAATDDKGVAAYRIYVNGHYWGQANGNASYATIANLQPSTAYTFQIEAVDAESAVSAGNPTVQATTLPPEPEPNGRFAGGRLAVDASGSTGKLQLTLSYSGAVGGAVGYELRMPLDQNGVQLSNPVFTPSPGVNLTAEDILMTGVKDGVYTLVIGGKRLADWPLGTDGTIGTVTFESSATSGFELRFNSLGILANNGAEPRIAVSNVSMQADVQHAVQVPEGMRVYDVNRDGEVTLTDYASVLFYIRNADEIRTKIPAIPVYNGRSVLSSDLGEGRYFYDVNLDSRINVTDATLILFYLADRDGITNAYPNYDGFVLRDK